MTMIINIKNANNINIFSINFLPYFFEFKLCTIQYNLISKSNDY